MIEYSPRLSISIKQTKVLGVSVNIFEMYVIFHKNNFIVKRIVVK